MDFFDMYLTPGVLKIYEAYLRAKCLLNWVKLPDGDLVRNATRSEREKVGSEVQEHIEYASARIAHVG